MKEIFGMLIGFVGLAIAIYFIVQLVKNRKNKDMSKKAMWWGLIIGLIIQGAGGSLLPDDTSSSASKSSSTDKAVSSQISKASSSKKAESSHKKALSSTKKSLAKSDVRIAALAILKENYKGVAKVTYDSKNKVFEIDPTSDSFKSTMVDLVDGNVSKSEWKKLTDSIDAVSKSTSKNVDSQISVGLVNPANTSKMLYMSKAGVTLYDFLND
ncbi:putative capsid protein [Lactobacillus acidophilus NCFM] [Lactiplantibacillus mudanjiangensis]|uniref:hypothetical protein n=1 Tax=Lactiplantibacillus mudanjiangensis TaxID=1296538 RepID=UPI00101428B8|nr:putative capsid protein [Lactobacillus acidophilus NCFM] [Lactiplantibacillus mudanjiangensis]